MKVKSIPFPTDMRASECEWIHVPRVENAERRLFEALEACGNAITHNATVGFLADVHELAKLARSMAQSTRRLQLAQSRLWEALRDAEIDIARFNGAQDAGLVYVPVPVPVPAK